MDYMDTVICRYGEIALKGGNRSVFEGKLKSNIERRLEGFEAKVSLIRGRVIVKTQQALNVANALKDVFGLVSVSPAVSCKPDIVEIENMCLSLAKEKDFETFRISANRADKRFPMKSSEIEIRIGSLIVSSLNKKVKLKNPDLDVCVEIRKECFVFIDRIPCYGGIPVGSSGEVVCLVENTDDLKAAWLVMKRGCSVKLALLSDTDYSALNRFSPFEIEVRKCDSLDDAYDFARSTKTKTIVTGRGMGSLLEKKDVLILYPLIASDVPEGIF